MSSWSSWLAVGAGGALGATLRLLVYRLVERWAPIDARRPWLRLGPGHATVLANLLGSFALGLLLGVAGAGTGAEDLSAASAATTEADWPRLFWTTGVCGSLTTFSTFCGEAIGLARRGQSGRLILYLVANAGLCLAALVIGMKLVA